MARRPSRHLILSSVAVLGLLAGAPIAAAESPAPGVRGADLVGSWTLVSADSVLPDGTRTQPYGAEPDGVLVFDAAGRYSVQIYRHGRAPFASGDKSHGTPEEYRATSEGMNAHFGTYVLDDVGRTLTFHIVHASFPNWEGTDQKRMITLHDGVLRYTVPVTTTGKNAVGEVTWRRLP
jgi:hypothetical protein